MNAHDTLDMLTLERLADDYEDLVRKAGPHRWGLITVEAAREVIARLRQERETVSPVQQIWECSVCHEPNDHFRAACITIACKGERP